MGQESSLEAVDRVVPFDRVTVKIKKHLSGGSFVSCTMQRTSH